MAIFLNLWDPGPEGGLTEDLRLLMFYIWLEENSNY